MKYIILILAISANLSFTNGQYSLALNLQQGNTYSLSIHSTNHITSEMNGRKMAVTSSMSGVMKFKVTRVGKEDYQLEASYDTLQLSLKSPMGNMEFSIGNQGQGNEITAGGMNGEHFTITLLKNGAVSKIETPDTSHFSDMLKNFPMAQAMKQMFMMGPVKQSFSKQAMKENMEKMTAIFPNKQVNINESWGSEIMPDSNSDHMVKTSYQLVSYEGGVATIKGHSETKAGSGHAQKMGFGMMMMFPLVYELTGESESTIQINTITGWIKQADIKNGLKGFVQMKKPDDKNPKKDPFQMEGFASLVGN